MSLETRLLTAVLIGALILSACAPAPQPSASPTQTESPTATIEPSPTPRPARNVAIGKQVIVSAHLASNPPERAVDTKFNDWWGSGAFAPQWIEIHLQGLYSISKISLSISQSPAGETVHRVVGRGVDQKDQLLHVFKGYTKDSQVLEFSPDTPWQDIAIIRIETTASPSWVSWREVQIFSREEPKPLPPALLPEKNISMSKPVRVSASWVVDPPERAVDGNLGNWWGAGGPPPAWIEVDLQGIYSISKIKVINQGPTGQATYQVLGRSPGGKNQLLHVFAGYKSENQTLEHSPETPWENISTIRVEILNGSGWAGFREVQVFSREDPRPLPVSGAAPEPLFLAQVQPAGLERITPDNAILMEQLSMLGRGPINELVWSPDGKTLAAASPLGIWLYDKAAPGTPPRLLEGHTRDVLSIYFSQDGATLFSGSQDGTVKKWDVATGKLKRTLWLWGDFSYEVGNQKRDAEVWSMAFSPDGSLLAAGSLDGTLRLWNLATSKPLNVLQGHTRQVANLAFSPDGALLASSGVDGSLFIWDVESGKQLTSLSSQGQIQSLVFSPDSKLLAYGGTGMTVRLWDVAAGKELAELSEHTAVIALAFSPDGLTLLSSSLVGTLRSWDVQSGSSGIFRESAGWIMSMAYSPDGVTLATYAWDGALRLWDVATASYPGDLATHASPVTSIAFSSDGALLAAAGEDGSVRLWEVETNSLRATLWGHVTRVFGVAFSPDGKLLASAGFDKTVRLWDVASGSQIGTLAGHESYVRCVAFSPDSKLVASGSTDKTVRLWNAATGEAGAILTGHAGEIQSVAFSPDGAWLVSASVDKTLRVWDVASGKEIGVLQGHLGFILGAAFSPDGKILASVSGDHSLRAWNLESVLGVVTGKARFPAIGHGGWVLSVAFSPDGAMIASANVSTTSYWVAPGEVHLYSADTGFPHNLLRAHTRRVTSVTFSPDGKLLASGSADGSVRLWGVKENALQPTLPVSTPTPVGWDPFVGEWVAKDPGDGSSITMTITRKNGIYDIGYVDDKASICGKDSDNRPRFGAEIKFTGALQGDVLNANALLLTCLSDPTTTIEREFISIISYQKETDTLTDTLNQALWRRR